MNEREKLAHVTKPQVDPEKPFMTLPFVPEPGNGELSLDYDPYLDQMTIEAQLRLVEEGIRDGSISGFHGAKILKTLRGEEAI